MWRTASPAREVVLHIGMGKTGTSAIQRFLADHRAVLLDGGVLYPHAMGPVRHTHLSHVVRGNPHLIGSLVWKRGTYADPASYRREHRQALRQELDAAGPDRVLFSDEGLYSLGPHALGKLRALLDGMAVDRTVLVYLRPQAEHLISRYQQSVKVGETRTLAEFAADDHSNIYDYAGRLAAWEAALAPARLVVRPFQSGRFVGGSLLSDLVAAVGLPVAPDPQSDVRRNESLDAASVEALRLLNLAAVAHDGARPGAIDNRALVEVLAQQPRGPVLTLPDDALDSFAAQWAEGNAEVADRHLGGTPLFREAPRSAATTTDQSLPADRLDELLELLQVPAERRTQVCSLRAAAAG